MNRDPDAGSRGFLYPGGNIKDNIGSYQDDEFRSHNHNFYIWTTKRGGDTNFNAVGGNNLQYVSNTGGNETRPKNVYVMFIIKY